MQPTPSWLRQKWQEKYRLIHALCEAQNWRCAYCSVEMTRDQSPTGWSRDHFIPRYHGGSDGWENLFASCQKCNSARGHFDALAFWRLVATLGQHGAIRAIRRQQSRRDSGKLPVRAVESGHVGVFWPPTRSEAAAENRINRRNGDAQRQSIGPRSVGTIRTTIADAIDAEIRERLVRCGG